MGKSDRQNPTLLVFTLGAKQESRRRQLLPAAFNPIEDLFHQTCLDIALAAGRAAGCRLEVSSPLKLSLPADVHHREQSGGDFGSRLEQATSKAFEDNGLGPLLLVGSDVPELDAAHLRSALQGLQEDPDRVVVGPSPDGGLYLLATSRPLEGVLTQVKWRCRGTLRSLKRALRRQGRPFSLLPPLVDLDRRADLEKWLSKSSKQIRRNAPWVAAEWRKLICQLREVLASLRRAADFERVVAPSLLTMGAFLQRGPPGSTLRLS